MFFFIVPGGLNFESSIETPLVSSSDGAKDLRVESLTKKLILNGPDGIQINSFGNDISFTSLKDIQISSKKGKVTLTIFFLYSVNSENIFRILLRCIPYISGIFRIFQEYSVYPVDFKYSALGRDHTVKNITIVSMRVFTQVKCLCEVHFEIYIFENNLCLFTNTLVNIFPFAEQII